MNLIINAPNVHMGGGLTLLLALLDNLDEDFQGRLIVDERLVLRKSLPRRLIVNRVRATVLGRLVAEWLLRKWTGTQDVVLCLGNLPPLFRLGGKVLVFLQNRYLVEWRSLKGFPFYTKIRITIERFWFDWGKRNVTRFIVQTPSMQRTVQEVLGKSPAVLPFLRNPKGYDRAFDVSDSPMNGNHGFLYVASGEPHKNHRNLIEAWELLATEGIRPSLYLTLDHKEFPELCTWIEKKRNILKLHIINMGTLPKERLHNLYEQARALIYPSDFESFGLPLVEARCEGLPILAAEKDYVRDAVDPEETFDPCSPVSIARAVKRFLGIREVPLPIVGPREYLARIHEIVET